MAFDSEILSYISAICRYVYKNPGVHKNTMRNDLVAKGKIATKDKFSRIFESLVALGKISVERDRVSLSQDFINTGILQSNDKGYYLITPGSDRHIKIHKSIAQGFEVDDVLDFMIERSGQEQLVFVLGRNKSPLAKQVVSTSTKKGPSKNPAPSQNLYNNTNVYQNSTPDRPSRRSTDQNRVLGRVVNINGDLVFVPNDKHMEIRFIPLLHSEEELPSFENRICVMTLVDKEAPLFGGSIVAVYGDAGNPIHEYEAIAREIGAVVDWEKYQREVDAIPTHIDLSGYSLISEEEALVNHRGHIADLRHIPFCPTDPSDAKDKDDAIFSTYDEDGNLVVYTAIANLTKFMSPDSELFKVYTTLGMTFYTPTRSYPITHPKLSSGVCAFKKGVDRFAFVVKTVHNRETGEVISQNFFDAVINCKEEYSYDQAQEIVNSYGDEDLRTHFEWKVLSGEPLSLDEQILMDFYTAQELKLGFNRRNRPNFSSGSEYRPKFTADQTRIIDIEQVPHLPYNEVIEYFMLTANEATARAAMQKGLDVAFRVHDAPSSKKIEGAHEFFDLLNISFDGNVSAEGLADLLRVVKGTAAEEMVSQFLIKMQSRAVYSDHPYNTNEANKDSGEFDGIEHKKISHFALQSTGYCHSTAPIRRSPDYPVLYNLIADIHGTKPLSKDIIQMIINNANDRQKIIDEAEREINLLNGVLYSLDHIGEQLHGTITRLRYTSPEEGYSDEIVAIVKNKDKGVVAEIPLSQIIGKRGFNYKLSPHGNAVYDAQGNVAIKICQPLDFIIESADKLTRNVVGRTNKSLVQQSGGPQTHKQRGDQSYITKSGRSTQKKKPYQPNKSNYKRNNRGKRSKSKHHNYNRDERDAYLSEIEFGSDE